MVNSEQIRKGLSAYLDAEIIPKLPGYKKWIFGGAASAYLLKLDNILERVRQKEAIAVLDIIKEDGMVDIDMIYKCIRPMAEQCSAQISLPVIGTITLTAADVDNIYNYVTR